MLALKKTLAPPPPNLSGEPTRIHATGNTFSAQRTSASLGSKLVIRTYKPPPPPPLPPPSLKMKDPGGIGFIDDIGGGVDGLMSCTESIGLESCEERRILVDDDDDDNDHHYHQQMVEFCERERDRWRKKRSNGKMRIERNYSKLFPPPLSSLNENGQPCFYLKPVRKDGRLELTEVKIQRPDILHAVRENGRLRLHLFRSHNDQDISSKINEEKEEKVEESWKHRVTEDGLKRCQEQVMNHHQDHHHNHGWRQPCVTTR
ncbi:protein FANTASTIC FOUR 3 [Gossypium raimondii]|uniref:FAF domain-containing protein n=1 Tax=Gossypium raimondii TaxID=29730 RepID=A0A0D2N375_GOSRA|nr:protein FANTASTIC FOUR 3 [Gossypium raimondii]KJB26477.1 hypothetical protein B456_004G243700 [Gossypium raimondii]